MAHLKYRIERTTYRSYPGTFGLDSDWGPSPNGPKKEIILEKKSEYPLYPGDFPTQYYSPEGGWVSHTFELQLFNAETGEWESVGFLKTKEER